MLSDIPTGTHCFVDANIFYYHLVNTPSLSDDCSDFLKRLERRDVIGSTSTVSIAEATHKVMLADAVSTHGVDRKGMVARLKREPQLLAALTRISHKLSAGSTQSDFRTSKPDCEVVSAGLDQVKLKPWAVALPTLRLSTGLSSTVS
ncbi:MAG TPA: hypothetical protein VJH03_21605 [Blastocatellia bacterium]|nr:hypothetical protein [Blastocatellia bacterium]